MLRYCVCWFYVVLKKSAGSLAASTIPLSSVTILIWDKEKMYLRCTPTRETRLVPPTSDDYPGRKACWLRKIQLFSINSCMGKFREFGTAVGSLGESRVNVVDPLVFG